MPRPSLPRPVRLLAWGLAAVVVLAVGTLGTLALDGPATRVTRAVLGRVLPEPFQLEVGRVTRLGLGGVTATDLVFEDPGTGVQARLDTVRAEYRLLSWRWGRVVLDDLDLVGLAVDVDRESTPETGDPDTESDPAPAAGDPEAPPWTVVLREVELRPGAVATTGADGSEAGFRVRAVSGAARGLVAPGLGVESWSLSLTFAPAGLPEGWATASARGRWDGGDLRIDTLSLRSPRSRVSGRLRLPVDSSWSRPGALEWRLEATPLALADLDGLVPVPGVVAGDSLTLTSWSEADGDSARVRLEAETSEGASATADLRWGRAGSTLGFDGTADVSEADLRRYFGETLPLGATSGTVGFEGWADWRDDGLTALEASLDVALAAPEGELSAEARLTRESGADGEARDSADLRIRRLRWGEEVEGSGRLGAVRSAEGVVWRGDLSPRTGGRLSGEGRLSALGDEAGPRWSADLRLDTVVEPRTGSRVTGRIRGDGVGASLPRNLNVALAPSRIADWAVDTVDVVWTGTGRSPEATEELPPWAGNGRIEGWAQGEAGRVSVDADIDVGTDGGRLDLRSVEVESVGLPATDTVDAEGGANTPLPALVAADEGRDGGTPDWRGTRVSGRADGVLRWSGPLPEAADPARWSGDVEAVLGAVAGSGPAVPVDTLRATLGLESGAVDARLRGGLPGGGRVSLRAAGPLTPPLEIRITEGRFEDVDLSRLSAQAPSTRLTGTLDGEVRGTGEATAPSIQGRIELDPSTVREGRIESLAIEVDVEPGRAVGDVIAELAGGTVRGRIDGPDPRDGSPWPTAPWRAEVEADLPRLGAFLGLPDSAVSVAGRVEAEADAGGGARIDLGLWRARGWGGRIDTAVVRGRLDGRLLALDTVLVRSNLGTADGGGTVPRSVLGLPVEGPFADSRAADSGPAGPGPPSGLTLAIVVPDSAAVLQLGGQTRVEVAGGRGDFEARCRDDECDLSGQVDLQTVLLGRWSVLALSAGLEGSVGAGRRFGPTRAGILVEGIRTPGIDARNATFQTHWDGTDLEVVGSALVDDRRAAVTELSLNPGARSLELRRLDLRFDEDRWALERPVTIRSDSSGLSLDSLVLTSAPQRILAYLAEEEGGRYLSIEADSLRLGAFTDLLGRPELGGSASGQLRLQGAEASVVLSGELAADLTVAGRPSHRIRARAEARQGAFTGDVAVEDPGGDPRITGHAEGAVPGVEDGRWTGSLELDDVPLTWAGAYAPEEWVRDATGSLHGSLALTGGTTEALRVEGPVELRSGRVVVPRASIVLDDIQLDAAFEGRTLRLNSAGATSRGRLTLEGSVTLPDDEGPPELDLRATSDDFLASNTRELELAFGADIAVDGTLAIPRIAGRLDVPQASYRIPAVLGRRVRDVTLTDEDWAILQSRFGIAPPEEDGGPIWIPRTAVLDLQVSLGRNIWLRRDANPELALQFTGDLVVTKSSQEDELQLQGSVETIAGRSYVEEFGRRFTVEAGSVNFRGPLDESRLEATAEYAVPTSPDQDPVTIGLQVTGWVDDLELSLSSEPSLSNGDIVSYLATGRPASSAFSGDGSAGIGADILASRLSGSLEQFAQEEVGLDVLQIQQEGLHGTSLVAGKYVNPRLFLGFRQGVTFQADEGRSFSEGLSSQAEVEYTALNWLVMNIQGGTSAIRFFLEGTYGW